MIDTAQSITSIEEHHTSGAYPKRPPIIMRGKGCMVWDEEGKSYIDATSGQGVALLGHCHPAVTHAIIEQSQMLVTCPEIFYNDRRAELYELLASITPGELNRFFLCNSGTEANEGALKVARLITNRNGIVAAKRGFHGRTLGSLSLTWNKKYREPFAEWQPQVTHIPFNNSEAARETIDKNTAAVFVEAVQGEGGIHPADPEYLQELRAICNETGALLIVDEIQTGFGRTGKWFAFEHAGILPDIITLGKGIAGGLPMGAVCWREALGQIPRGSHGSTFGGNPLACAAAIATIRALTQANIPDVVAEIGEWLIAELRALELQEIRELRGKGLMVGLELRGRVTPVLQELQARGVLALPAGINTLRLLPPLIITREELQTVAKTIQEALQSS